MNLSKHSLPVNKMINMGTGMSWFPLNSNLNLIKFYGI
jgi:hypothetical protein